MISQSTSLLLDGILCREMLRISVTTFIISSVIMDVIKANYNRSHNFPVTFYRMRFLNLSAVWSASLATAVHSRWQTCPTTSLPRQSRTGSHRRSRASHSRRGSVAPPERSPSPPLSSRRRRPWPLPELPRGPMIWLAWQTSWHGTERCRLVR